MSHSVSLPCLSCRPCTYIKVVSAVSKCLEKSMCLPVLIRVGSIRVSILSQPALMSTVWSQPISPSTGLQNSTFKCLRPLRQCGCEFCSFDKISQPLWWARWQVSTSELLVIGLLMPRLVNLVVNPVVVLVSQPFWRVSLSTLTSNLQKVNLCVVLVYGMGCPSSTGCEMVFWTHITASFDERYNI